VIRNGTAFSASSLEEENAENAFSKRVRLKGLTKLGEKKDKVNFFDPNGLIPSKIFYFFWS
jgi:hypothetical protein